MNKCFIKEYNKVVDKIINREYNTITRAINSINKSKKIKKNTKRLQNKVEV